MAKEEAALCSLVASSLALPWIALPVAFLLPAHRVGDLNLSQFDRGKRSKAGGERLNA